ncbi:MAG: VanW family protein [Patescibacteria group bacterium]
MKKINIFYIFILFLTLAFFSLPVKATKNQSPNTDASQSLSPFSFNELSVAVGDQKEIISRAQLEGLILTELSLKINSAKRSEIENINYCPTSKPACKLLSSINRMLFLRKETKFFPDKQKIEIFVNSISEKFDRDPVDAKFKLEGDGTVSFTPEQEGLMIKPEESIVVLSENLISSGDFKETKEISLPYETTDPKVKTSDVNNLGINTIIGEGKSNFRGSPKNRIFNINVAIKKFNGVLIKLGEEFSFVETLGPVDEEHGYAPELVIKKDKTEPEFGGGICQVSTTAFRAAINSGLEITARRNHAYPVAYYNPQGMDATVYIPRPDLRFINNTPNNILIQTKIEGTILTFQFFGTDDGRKVEIIGPKVIERNPDGSMKATFTQKVTDKDGNLIINDVFNSNYDSPSKYPHPGEEKITSKPKGWSDNEWKKYKKTNGI